MGKNEKKEDVLGNTSSFKYQHFTFKLSSTARIFS